MHILSIDYETFSGQNIKKVGLHKYLECPRFEIMLIAYSIDDGPEISIDLTKGWTPEEDAFVEMLTDPEYLKTSHNAAFEVGASERHWNITCDLKQWECTQVRCAYIGWPLGLGEVAKAMKLDVSKITEGKKYIAFFCSPVKPTKVNKQTTRNLAAEYTAKWEKFIEYNLVDLRVERAIRQRLINYPLPEKESALWRLDQHINRRGVNVNADLVRKVIEIDKVYKATLTEQAKELTEMSNPNSRDQILDWIEERTGEKITKLRKEDIEGLIEQFSEYPDIVEMLELRGDMSKTSIAKYDKIRMAICADGRLRGLFQFYGANRTGRWAGRLTQVHNLVRNDLDSKSDPEALDRARSIVLSKLSIEDKIFRLEMLYGSVPDVLSKLVRTVFIPAEGNTLLISDLASIEARILAYLAGEEWKLQVFRTHGKIYEATGAQMFGVPMSAVTKDSEYRRKAKISELALGYNGGPDAMKKMGAVKMGMVEEELPKIVKMWRNANKMICRYWTRVNDAAILAIKNPGVRYAIGMLEDETTAFNSHGIGILVKDGYMFVYLPSGRHLTYVRPRIIENRFGGEGIAYDGVTKVWGQQETYGGKLVENIVQAVARDVLAEGLTFLNEKHFNTVMHVHDEVVVEYQPHMFSMELDEALEEVNGILKSFIPWAPDLPLGAEGFTGQYYKKD